MDIENKANGNANGHAPHDQQKPNPMHSFLGMIFAFLAMLFAIIALAVVASKDVEAECNFDTGAIDNMFVDKLGASEAALRSDITDVHHVCARLPERSFLASGLEMVALAYNNMGNIGKGIVPNAERRYEGLASQLKPIGSITASIAEASDAGDRVELIKDGESGDVDFPHGNLKPILTIGEYDANTGYIPVGVPDGQGAYLKDMHTARLIFQAESYGHISGNPSWYLPVNDGAALFTGSHITYVDYNKDAFHSALESDGDVAATVKEAGELFNKVVNLAGEFVNFAAVHYGDTGANGDFVSNTLRSAQGEWTFHSFCSAHLEEKHQWGTNIGVEDDMFVTVEEWTSLDAAKVAASGFVGLSAHVVDIDSKTIYAAGAFGMGGWEKIVEFNCNNPNYVCFSASGYNGNFGGSTKSILVDRRKTVQPTRADGTEWVYPQDINPARVYIGVKGYNADGTACGASCGFLAKNGLAYGRSYGFAVPSDTEDRDPWHKGKLRASTPAVDGVFARTAWQWDGVVRDFEHDQAWDFQDPPPTRPSYKFWNAKGRDAGGAKTEHNAPDPRGGPRFMQGSTAGYYGIYDLTGLASALTGLSGNQLPDEIVAKYELLEGETAINDRIKLNGKGKRADGNDQTMMFDGSDKATFEDIDGLYWFAAAGNHDFVMIQEDGGNRYGERTFITQVPPSNVNPVYHFIAQAGGALNTRVLAKVGIPARTWQRATANEFSGASDFSGIFKQTTLGGVARHAAEESVAIQDKWFAVGLQGHVMGSGIVHHFGMDRGGQIYAYKPANLTFY